jgi:hypothetical protein
MRPRQETAGVFFIGDRAAPRRFGPANNAIRAARDRANFSPHRNARENIPLLRFPLSGSDLQLARLGFDAAGDAGAGSDGAAAGSGGGGIEHSEHGGSGNFNRTGRQK